MLCGLVLLAAFAPWELRVSHPALDVRCFAKRPFSAAAVALCLLFFALMGGTFVMTFYLQSIRGYSAFQAGLCVLPLAGALIAFAPRAPKLVRTLRHASGLQQRGWWSPAVGLLLLANDGQRHAALGARARPLCLRGRHGPRAAAGHRGDRLVSAEEEAGASSAINNTFRQVGASLGVAVLGSLLASLYHSRIDPALRLLPAASEIPGA